MVKRYDFEVEMRGMALEEAHLLCKERPDGDWVNHDDYAALASELAALKEQMRWRDVREELPELGVECLWLDGNNSMFADIQIHIDTLTKTTISGNVCCAVNYLHNYTHWMPLPSHPTTTSNED